MCICVYIYICVYICTCLCVCVYTVCILMFWFCWFQHFLSSYPDNIYYITCESIEGNEILHCSHNFLSSLGFEVYTLVPGLLGGSLSPGPGCPHHRRHWRTGYTNTEQRNNRKREELNFLARCPLLLNCVYLRLCVLTQVSAIYFTSADISLFERLSLRTDSDSAEIILWDELVEGKHRSCYTVTHHAHMPAWVRKGRK